ncbi:non-ribosomal peptide synthetase [Bradyrhizobium sp. BR 10261]|uniref:non-ribosomal peptide synthetase n=1 Tax=Bradyrhizobium sp. BR 10261 TaxID=2749992 RepID=UPI001C6494D8|nr:non-ribosomal peptide synthetase [Bradyrhizobium sp. BR 10261]MBW7967053.1 amino acid adenylation domain-containing protein [Bradyrhizobium sp. BR 10261]
MKIANHRQGNPTGRFNTGSPACPQRPMSMIEDLYALSPLQQGMLFHSLSAPGTGVYTEQLLCDLHEAVDEDSLRRAWRIVVARHPVLRSQFRWIDVNEPQQQVQAQVEIPWQQQDWRGIPDSEQDRRMADLLETDRRREFDLARAPLLRLTLVRCGEAKNRLIWTFHHALLDGRSFPAILGEVFSYYEALRAGTAITLECPRPYRDYIKWLQTREFAKSETFWRSTLKGFTAPTPLVVDRLPTNERNVDLQGGNKEILLSREITSALRSLAEQNELTVNTIIQGAWSVLLSRYSGEADVVFGVTRSCRRSTIEGAEAMIGLFINTLPLRVCVDRDAALIPWLKEVRAAIVAMREHEHTPLEKVQAWSDVSAGRPLFESIVVFENHQLNSLLQMRGRSWSTRQFHLFEQSNYPITLAAYDGTELCLKIGFDRGRLDSATAGRMLGHLQTLLEAMAEKPQQRLGDLPLLGAAERHDLLVAWNETLADYPKDGCIHELFEAQVDRTPDAVAVEFGEQRLTYSALNHRSNQLAHHLRELGVGPEVLVAICLERSPELIISLFGVLKAGGAYVPIDPAYPPARIAFMLKDANAPVLLTERKLSRILPDLKANAVIFMDDPAVCAGSVGNPNRAASDSSLAYVNYTSGSTGNPKGVMIPHRAVRNLMTWMQSTFPLNEGDRVLQQISFSFDPAVLEILAPLFVGARLVLARPGGHRDPAYLVQTIIRSRITVMHLVPSTLRLLLKIPELKACRSLRHVFCGGDVLTGELAGEFFGMVGAELHYFYGPTEATITSLFYSVPRQHADDVVPIGLPVANTQAHVLDAHMRHVPVGVPGELYLGGIQIARGYHNQPELTCDRFIGDPFSKAPGARLYKTGDMVRRLPNGMLQFLGRADHQVKIRGHRIELGEIETVVTMHPAVQEAAVVARENSAGDKRLIAYVRPAIPSAGLGAELRKLCRDQLPTYMIPADFIFLDAFPTTPNGKLDRGALPLPGVRSSQSEELYVPPSTPMEEAVISIWCELLELKKIGIKDDFFELGGHSLMAVRVINRIKQVTNVTLGISDLYKSPTVEELSKVIATRGLATRPPIVELQKGNAERPVYFVYAGPDEFGLAAMLDNQVFGIDMPPWPLQWRAAVANNRKSAFPTIEQLVAPYAAALSAHLASSSCVLAGHSFAGIIAFEMAHQLQKQGRRVDLVMLFDTSATYPTTREVAWRKCRQIWKQAPNELSSPSIASRLQRSWQTVHWMLDEEARKWFRGIWRGRSTFTTMVDEDGAPLPTRLVERLYTRILRSYRPRLLDTRGVLFRSEPGDGMRGLDDSLGWKGLFLSGLEIVPVNGDHLSMFREHNRTLAQRINAALKRYDTISECAEIGPLRTGRAASTQEGSAFDISVPDTHLIDQHRPEHHEGFADCGGADNSDAARQIASRRQEVERRAG